MGNTLDLTKGVIWKTLLLFAMPILVGSMFQQFYLIVDAMIVGRYLGSTGLAAIDSVNAMLRLPINLFTGLATGATILISKYFGEHNYERLDKALHSAICFSLFGGILLTLLGITFAPQLIGLMGVPSSIYPLTLSYVRIYFGGLWVTLLYNMSAGILRALGNSKTPLYVLIIASLINILLDFVFVAILNLSVGGAALATILAQLISALLLLDVLRKLDSCFALNIKKIHFDKDETFSIIRLGAPIGFQSSLYPIANMLIQNSINTLGTVSIAAWAVMGKIDTPAWLLSDSMSSALITFIAQNVGAKEQQRASEAVKQAMIILSIIIGALSLVFYFGSYYLGMLFVREEAVLLETKMIMRLQAFFYIFFAIGDVFSSAVKGYGETMKPMIISLLGTCVSRVIWILFVVPSNHTLLMIDLAYPISWTLNGILQFLLYKNYCSKLSGQGTSQM